MSSLRLLGAYLPAGSPQRRETDVRFSIHRRLYIGEGALEAHRQAEARPEVVFRAVTGGRSWEVFGSAPGRRIGTGSRRGAMRRLGAGNTDTGLRTDRSPDPGE